MEDQKIKPTSVMDELTKEGKYIRIKIPSVIYIPKPRTLVKRTLTIAERLLSRLNSKIRE